MIGKRLKKLRQQKNMSAVELGEKLGVTKSTIHRWEAGERNPSDTDKQKIARIFGITVAQLLGESLGPRLETTRQKAGLTLEELARKIDASPETLEAWENEEKEISLEALGKIREALKISYSELLDGMPSPVTKEQAREQIEWGSANSDDVPTGMLGLCLDWPGLVRDLAPSWNIEKALEKRGIMARKELQGGSEPFRKYALTPVPLLDPEIFAACCGEGICYECLETYATEMVPWALEPLGITYTEGMFCLKAEGDSMKQAGILNGALCLVVPYSDLGNGDVVLAVYGGNTKRWLIRYFFPKPDGSVILRAANPEYEDILITREERDLEWLTILGEVMALQSLPRRGL